MWPFLVREKREAFQLEAAAKLAPLQQRKRKAEDAIVAAFTACERACQQERDLLRQLEDLTTSERSMFELDHAKDQTMTTLKLALANLVMWIRDTYFPAAYAHATWHWLASFFRLPGRVTEGKQTIWVELRPFNDRQLNRDLKVVCEQVTAAQPRLPDGRRLCFTLAGTLAFSSGGQPCKVV